MFPKLFIPYEYIKMCLLEDLYYLIYLRSI